MAETSESLYERPTRTFELDPRVIEWVLADEANPLNRLVHMIPAGARVLDIGAGNGMLGRLLNHVHSGIIVDGVEPDPAAAAIAKPCYRTLFQCDAERFLEAQDDSLAYDYVVLADVIEHIPNPERLLRQLRLRLIPHARICLSTPNVAFASVRVALLNGRFDYVESGILERTHLRFFTLRSLQQLFAATRLFPAETMLLKRNPMHMEVRLQDYPIGPFALRKMLRDELAGVYQFLFVLGTQSQTGTVSRFGDSGRGTVLRYLAHRCMRHLVSARRAGKQGTRS